MNYSMILYILGHILRIEGAFMAMPALVGLLYHEGEGFAYLFIGIAAVLTGTFLSRKKPERNVFYLKEGCIATSLSWILMSLVGGLPFIMTGEIPSFVDALFETVSGFTTTGASILRDVEAMSYTSLFWRNFTNWIGGMGVLVFLLAIVPLSGGSNINLMRAESPGPAVEKLRPKMKYTAQILYLIYIIMTLVEFILLLAGGMPAFDAITHTFGTAGTGGFGIKNSSLGGYSPYCQWVVTIFMVLFGVNFNAYYLMLFRRFRKAFAMEEVRWYFILIAGASALIFIDIVRLYSTVFESLTHAVFQVSSIITTTGFSTTDFNLWSPSSKWILITLMFIGACAGSTGGGIKVSRVIITIKAVCRELRTYIHPKSIQNVKIDDKQVSPEIIRSINVYLITLVIIFVMSVFLISLEGYDLVTNFSAVATTLNNIGPGLELVGPTQNFALFSPFSKLVLIFDMLAGRLELFPLLLLFHPSIWKDAAQRMRIIKNKT